MAELQPNSTLEGGDTANFIARRFNSLPASGTPEFDGVRRAAATRANRSNYLCSAPLERKTLRQATSWPKTDARV